MVKQIIGILIIVTVIMVVTAGTCGFAAGNVLTGILENRPEKFEKSLGVVRWCGNGLPYVDKLSTALNNKTYIVLLQNNTELRSSGGFMGSFVKIYFDRGGMKDLLVQDIYQPDGQLPGHVEPPYPIQEAFGQGWWKLRDANWDVDYEKSGETITWFLEQGGVGGVDGVIAVNLDLVRKWLKILGEVETVTYGETVTADNVYSLAQRYAEENWKPGSTQKRDFLGAVGVAMMERTKVAAPAKIFELTKLVWQELKNRQIILWFKDSEMMRISRQRGWTGKLVRGADDYIYMVESNLGANKANCCIERKLNISGETKNEVLEMQITAWWRNNNPFENPKPPESWGGNYINYLRLVVGNDVEILSVEVDEKLLRKATENDFEIPNSLRQGRSEEIYVEEERGNFKTVGFWSVVPAGGEARANIKYIRKIKTNGANVQVVRQPGIENWPLIVSWNGETLFEGKLAEKEKIFTSH